MVGDANRRGYALLLDKFWDECKSHSITLPTAKPVSAAALCQARSKISTDLLRHLVQSASARFEDSFDELSRWHGRRVFAVDGSKFSLSRSVDLDRHFGRPQRGNTPHATVSALVNVMNGLPYDLVIGPASSDERELAMQHLDVVERGDVLVMDRGYPSEKLLRDLSNLGIDFLVRVPTRKPWNIVRDFLESGKNDRCIRLKTNKTSPKCEPVDVRLIKSTAPDGDEAVYLTSLRKAHVSRHQIVKLYRKRWEVEELYKVKKANYFNPSQFHARSPHGVKQEILAQALFVVLSRFLMATAARSGEHAYRDLSVKNAILCLSEYITRICITDPRAYHAERLVDLLDRLDKVLNKRRPGRIFPRRSFKPNPKWGASGRRRG